MPERLREEQLEVLKLLYPWYKEEVYRRREQMMRLTALGSGSLVLLLVGLLLLPAPSSPNPVLALFAGTGVALFTATIAYLIRQQRNRHRMAKQVLIELERALGLYEEGGFQAGKTLYPDDWQTSWLQDRSVNVYLTILATLTVLLIASLVLRS